MFNSCCEHSFSGKIAKYFFHSGLKFVTFQKLFMPTFNFLSRFLSVVCLCLLWGSCTIRRRYAWNSHTHKGIWHKGICTVLSPSKHSVNSICLIFEALRDRPSLKIHGKYNSYSILLSMYHYMAMQKCQNQVCTDCSNVYF